MCFNFYFKNNRCRGFQPLTGLKKKAPEKEPSITKTQN